MTHESARAQQVLNLSLLCVCVLSLETVSTMGWLWLVGLIKL